MIEKTNQQARIQAASNLEYYRIRAGYPSASKAAEAAGIPVSTYIHHEGGSRGFKKHLSRYAALFGVTIDDLLAPPKPKPAPNPSKSNQSGHSQSLDITTIRTELLGEMLQKALGIGQHCFAMVNPDLAMTGGEAKRAFSRGDLLIFDKSKKVRAGDFALVRITAAEEPIFRQIYPQADGALRIKALNRDIDTHTLSASTRWEILGKLVAVAYSA